MRRTTISRSNWLIGTVAAVSLAGASLAAQDTTQAKPRPAADTTPPAAAAPQADTLQGLQGGTHTVVKGETLWSIAKQYFNDALLWPEIYRLNTSIIDDPHWIYPGEVLALGESGATTVAQAVTPAETTQVVAQPAAVDTVHAKVDTTAQAETTVVVAAESAAAPAETAIVAPPPPPPPETENYTTIFDHPRQASEQVENTLRAYLHQPYRPVRRGEFYAAGWLTENEKLPWAAVIGSATAPAIHRLTQRTTAYQFEQVVIRPPDGASYHVGDSLLVAHVGRDVPPWGEVVMPTGVARVTALEKDQVRAEVLQQFGQIHDGNVALPLEPFKDPGQVRPAAVDNGLEGHLIAPRDPSPLAEAQAVYFIDKGRADGITPGDVFEVLGAGNSGTEAVEERVQLLIVHTREHSASGIVIGIRHPDVAPGMTVRLIKKMPS